MKVRVYDLNCNGAIFTVVDQGKDFYIVDSGGYKYIVVRKAHCEVIPEPEQQPQFNIGDTVEVCDKYRAVITDISSVNLYTLKFSDGSSGTNYKEKNIKLIKRSSTDNPPTATVIPAKVQMEFSIEQAEILKSLMAHMGKREIALVLRNSPNHWKPEVFDECHKLANDIYCELRDKLEVLE